MRRTKPPLLRAMSATMGGTASACSVRSRGTRIRFAMISSSFRFIFRGGRGRGRFRVICPIFHGNPSESHAGGPSSEWVEVDHHGSRTGRVDRGRDGGLASRACGPVGPAARGGRSGGGARAVRGSTASGRGGLCHGGRDGAEP